MGTIRLPCRRRPETTIDINYGNWLFRKWWPSPLTRQKTTKKKTKEQNSNSGRNFMLVSLRSFQRQNSKEGCGGWASLRTAPWEPSETAEMGKQMTFQFRCMSRLEGKQAFSTRTLGDYTHKTGTKAQVGQELKLVWLDVISEFIFWYVLLNLLKLLLLRLRQDLTR